MPHRAHILRIAFFVVALPTLGACSDSTAPRPNDPRLFLTSSAGDAHTCGVTMDGTLLCWGLNGHGQVGDGTDEERRAPTEVALPEPFNSVSAGYSHTCGLTEKGTAYCWGSNDDGQLGIASEDYERLKPARVATEVRFSSISAGRSHTCAVSTEGKAFCWGSNYRGRLGAPASEECGYYGPCSRFPVQVSGAIRWKQVSVGDFHTCGLAKGGSMYCWGSNLHGELGTTTTETCEDTQGEFDECSTSPVPVSGGMSWQDLDVGKHHTCALAGNDRMYCWGVGGYGALGDGIDHDPDDWWSFRREPGPVVGDLRFMTLSAGGRTCAVTTLGIPYCWGVADLGDGTGEDSSEPVPVATSAEFSLITTGGGHTCGMGREGVLYCWGSNRFGQLGDGSHATRWLTPVPVKGWW